MIKTKTATNKIFCLHLVVLSILVWFCFSRTLSTYFLADDFGEIAYVSRIMHGEPGLIWLNFTGNFMQIPSMSVWRPWLLISLLADFIIWKANPIGYYLTNLLSYNAAVLLFYWLLRQITRTWSSTRSGAAALLASCLFAASPLHCESISWVVGRVDIVSCVFYLLCLNFLFKAAKKDAENNKDGYKKWQTLSVICFWLGMWTKEMPIGLPVLVPFLMLALSEGPLSVKRIAKLSAPIWISTVVYLGLRVLALGTLFGGYTQGIGDAQAAHALSRWLDKDTMLRLFFPLAYGIFGQLHTYQKILATLYTLLSGLLLVRLFCFRLSGELVKFLLLIPLWAFTTLIPIYKLWGLGYELEGARFCFFLTMPLAAALPLLLMAPERKGQQLTFAKEKKTNSIFAVVSAVILFLLVASFSKIAQTTNLAWVHTGKEVREFSQKSRLLDQEENGKLLLLGIPKRQGGAHMILNGTTFQVLKAPPFVPDNSAKIAEIHTFDPIIFGNDKYIDAPRFKALYNNGQGKVLIWHGPHREFKQITYGPTNEQQALPELVLPGVQENASAASRSIGYLHSHGHARALPKHHGLLLHNIQTGDCLAFGGLELSPLRADYLEVKLNVEEKGNSIIAAAIDDGLEKSRVEKIITTTGHQTIYLPVSSNWHWFAHNKIETIYLIPPAGGKVIISSLRLVSADDVRPALTVTNAKMSTMGVHNFTRQTTEVDLKLTSKKPFTHSAIELSKPNAFFENCTHGDVGEEESVIAKTYLSAINTTTDGSITYTLTIPVKDLTAGVFQQARVRILDNNARTVGEPSTPVNLRLD